MSTQAELIKDCVMRINILELRMQLALEQGNEEHKKLLEVLLAEERNLLEQIKSAN